MNPLFIDTAYRSFCSMKQLGVLLSPSGKDASPSQITPLQFVRFPQQFSVTHLYSWVERGTVKVKCLVQEHKTGHKPRLIDLGTSALTMGPSAIIINMDVINIQSCTN